MQTKPDMHRTTTAWSVPGGGWGCSGIQVEGMIEGYSGVKNFRVRNQVLFCRGGGGGGGT